ncbi:hypothetical protein SKAU_G00028090 [Synaphobranchus kaupii]|uniref:Uncharacterized protein n=1 Tax=Synaphobranchus kaupii TaxID=118154 RepID=A0A9Q1JCV8_SYNKA|nr:hypothetical protein SKAU_G00028090 [Synaphobranchus kaupii]
MATAGHFVITTAAARYIREVLCLDREVHTGCSWVSARLPHLYGSQAGRVKTDPRSATEHNESPMSRQIRFLKKRAFQHAVETIGHIHRAAFKCHKAIILQINGVTEETGEGPPCPGVSLFGVSRPDRLSVTHESACWSAAHKCAQPHHAGSLNRKAKTGFCGTSETDRQG